MDKTIINYDKKRHSACEVHRMPAGRQEFHRRYGLWICRIGQQLASMPVFKWRPRYFEYYSLSHLLAGRGRLWRSEYKDEIDIYPGDGVLISPGYLHYYGGSGMEYIEDSICFTGLVADQFFESGIIRNGIIRIGNARRLLPIQELAVDPSRNSQIRANLALQNLLAELHFENCQAEQTRHPAVELLIDAIRREPRHWWTVSEMASYCRLSEVHFRRVFRQRTGLLPKRYVDRLKISLAANRVAESNAKLEDLAAEFGYQDVFHFSRRFKQLTGFSPKRYRRELSG